MLRDLSSALFYFSSPVLSQDGVVTGECEGDGGWRDAVYKGV